MIDLYPLTEPEVLLGMLWSITFLSFILLYWINPLYLEPPFGEQLMIRDYIEVHKHGNHIEIK